MKVLARYQVRVRDGKKSNSIGNPGGHDPARAVDTLAGLAQPYLLASVPREPVWRVLNLARGKYLGSLGNTPGHVNHWSRAGFLALLSRRFDRVETRTPLPWTMALCRRR